VVRTLTTTAEVRPRARRRGQLPTDAGILPHLRDAELSRSAPGAAAPRQGRPPDRRGAGPTRSISRPKPIGLLVRRYCRKHDLPFTTSFHTRFPDYVSARAPVPEYPGCGRPCAGFMATSEAVMAADPGAGRTNCARAVFCNVVLLAAWALHTLAVPAARCRSLPAEAGVSLRRPGRGWKRISRRFSISICPAPR